MIWRVFFSMHCPARFMTRVSTNPHLNILQWFNQLFLSYQNCEVSNKSTNQMSFIVINLTSFFFDVSRNRFFLVLVHFQVRWYNLRTFKLMTARFKGFKLSNSHFERLSLIWRVFSSLVQFQDRRKLHD